MLGLIQPVATTEKLILTLAFWLPGRILAVTAVLQVHPWQYFSSALGPLGQTLAPFTVGRCILVTGVLPSFLLPH